MSRLADRRRRVSASTDRAFASLTRVIPMLGGQGSGYVVPVADPDRPHFDATGVVVQTTAHSKREGQGARSAVGFDHRAASYRVSYAADAFGPNQPPAKKDRIVLLEEPGSPELEVAHIEPAETAHGRHIVHLAKV